VVGEGGSVKAPFPWFGGKRRVAPIVWDAFGDPTVYVEPFFGSGAVLLGRTWPSGDTRVETVNDRDGFVANVWRAIRSEPDRVAEWARWPVNENDLHARHAWLVERRADLTARLEGDPEWFDAKIAGWWLWGTACWVGGGFCSGQGPWNVVDDGDGPKLVHLGDAGRGVNRKLVHLGDAGRGVNRKLVHLGDGLGGLEAWMEALAARLERVRVCCGDWSRVVTPAAMASAVRGVRAVFLDPPYSSDADRDMGIYAVDDGTIAHDVRAWCLANGDNPNLRIALCGYVGEGHDVLAEHGWRIHRWSASGGMSKDKGARSGGNNTREAIWFSPHCRQPAQAGLFDKETAS
jgi:hypothetical protein